MSIDDHQQEVLNGILPTTILSEVADWFQNHLEPNDIFAEVQLIEWAFANGFTKKPPSLAPKTPGFWYDDQVSEIANSECSTCRKLYRIIEVSTTTVETECDCGLSEFDLEPPNEMDEAAIHY